MVFHFRRFDAVEYEVRNISIPWRFRPAQPSSSFAELILLVTWKCAYLVDRLVGPVRRALTRSILNVYQGVWLPHSDLRAHVVRMRNDCQYGTEGAGIDVGYAPLPGQTLEGMDKLRERFLDPKVRLHMQMYAKVASFSTLTDKHVLEVGCGQGDGAAFLTQVRSPAKCIGLDRHSSQITFSRTRHGWLSPRLTFVRGDALRLPFPDGSFDAVVNVESAHSYPNFEQFVAEVFRVLRRDGVLCFADLRKASDSTLPWVEVLGGQFTRAGFRVLHYEDITKNAWASLDELRTTYGGRLWDEWETLRRLFGSREFEYHLYVVERPG